MSTVEIVVLFVLVLVPYSIYRQMQVAEVDPGGLIKLPLIYIAIGILGFGVNTRDIDGGAGPDGYLLVSIALAIGFGIWRGRKIDVWRSEAGDGWLQQGNKTTLMLWVAMILSKVVLGTVASITDLYPGEQTGEIFVFIGASFAIQNVIVAQRTIWHDTLPVDALKSQMKSQRPADARTE